jgi:hypothetical protein
VKLAEAQHEYEDFIARSKDRVRQSKILREMFQSGELPVTMFRHLIRKVRAEQAKAERLTGFSYVSPEFDSRALQGTKRGGLRTEIRV